MKDVCPAKTAVCTKCTHKGHYAKCCKTTIQSNSSERAGVSYVQTNPVNQTQIRKTSSDLFLGYVEKLSNPWNVMVTIGHLMIPRYYSR